jgi:hypothetical protein
MNESVQEIGADRRFIGVGFGLPDLGGRADRARFSSGEGLRSLAPIALPSPAAPAQAVEADLHVLDVSARAPLDALRVDGKLGEGNAFRAPA